MDYLKEINSERNKKKKIIDVAMGREKADTVLKNASYVNVFSNEILSGDIAITCGCIAGIGEYSGIEEIDVKGKIVIPGLIDAHIHLESSLVSPVEFSKVVIQHGTTTVITDPHEIANVMGTKGIQYMLEATENLPLEVKFMLPSCVPATSEDESGAVLDYSDIDQFYDHKRVTGLAEMMNYVGVYMADTDVLNKISAAKLHNKIIDGHAPFVEGEELNAYAAAGIYSDHECSNPEEAIKKIQCGQYILIREGTAAKNLNALMPIIQEKYSDRLMFCYDDAHPLELIADGHIDYIVKRVIKEGVNPVMAIKIACYNPARYFRLEGYGAIAPGYNADIVIIDNFEDFKIEKVFKNGILKFSDNKLTEEIKSDIDSELVKAAHNTFKVRKLNKEDFELSDDESIPVIGMIPGEIITEKRGSSCRVDVEKDILKIAVIERHKGTGHIGVGYINGYGLKEGAVATSISHDSHNIIVVGTNDEDMAVAANKIIEMQGGITVVNKGKTEASVSLEIAGLMSEESLTNVNSKLEEAKAVAHVLGVYGGIDPFMTLSFMSLTVIPSVRISTKGVVEL